MALRLLSHLHSPPFQRSRCAPSLPGSTMRVTASHLNAKALTRAGSDGIVAAASASARSTSAKIGNAELLRVIAPRRARYVVRFLSPRFLSHRVEVAECLSFSLEKTRSKRKPACNAVAIGPRPTASPFSEASWSALPIQEMSHCLRSIPR